MVLTKTVWKGNFSLYLTFLNFLNICKMSNKIIFLLLCFTSVVKGQTPADIVQSFGGNAAAFTWPIPFAHIPQTFTKQAVRFTAPHNTPFNSQMTSIDVRVWGTSKSQDGFNDSLVVRFLSSTPDGTPDENAQFVKPFKVVLSSLSRGSINTIGLGKRNLVFAPKTNVWVTLEVETVGKQDTLVLISDNAEIPALGRAAAYVSGTGWMMMRDTQFNNEYIFQIAAKWRATSLVAREEETTPQTFARLDVFPNPFQNNPNIRFQSDKSGQIQITVFDLIGRKLFEQEAANSEDGGLRLNLPSNLPQGVYVLQIQQDQHVFHKRLIKTAR